MSSEQFSIDFKPLGRGTGSPLERAFYADIGLSVGEEWLTQLEDIDAQTIRTHMRGCSYQLAVWFASNWWRLRWEPEISWKDPEWRVAHSVAGAGGGYVWPNILFASDGDSLAVASRPRRKAATFEPIRYLNPLDARISASEFEQKVDCFVEGVLSRLSTFGLEDDSLPLLWEELRAERNAPESYRRRKLEAMAGFDPDQAPDDLLIQLLEDKANLGAASLEELAAQTRHFTPKILRKIAKLASSNKLKISPAIRGEMPVLSQKLGKTEGERPWQSAAKLARMARKEWNLGKKPVSNKVLGDLLKTNGAVFSERAKSSAPLPIALKAGQDGYFDIYFTSSWETNRRFATGRMIGDHLYFENPGRLIAATEAKTSRQQFQRAFAQEFLCPHDALLEKIQTERPSEEDISEAAAYFDVSPLMVRTTLVNNGDLDRDALSWQD